jgi:hypothetical protein
VLAFSWPSVATSRRRTGAARSRTPLTPAPSASTRAVVARGKSSSREIARSTTARSSVGSCVRRTTSEKRMTSVSTQPSGTAAWSAPISSIDSSMSRSLMLPL